MDLSLYIKEFNEESGLKEYGEYVPCPVCFGKGYRIEESARYNKLAKCLVGCNECRGVGRVKRRNIDGFAE